MPKAESKVAKAAYDIKKINAKVAELEVNLSKPGQLNPEGKAVKVDFIIVVNDVTDTNPAVGYFRQPDKHTYMTCMDMYQRSSTRAAELYVESCMIKDASDKRLFGDSPDDFDYWKGALQFASEALLGKKIVLKKKS